MSMTVNGSDQGANRSESQEKQISFGEMQGWTFDTICFTHALGGITRSIKGIVEPFFQIPAKISAGIGGTQFTSALLMPFGLWELACDVYGVFTKETFWGKVDSGLGAIGGIGEGADCVANITEGLVSVGAVTAEAAAWAGPLGMAAAGLSAIFIAVHAKAIHNNRYAFKALKKARVKTGDAKNIVKSIDVAKLIEKLSLDKHKYRLESAGVDAQQVINKLNVVKDQDDADVKVNEIYKGLKTRIKEKQACHGLGIVIIVIGIVAAAILFATALTPWAIAAFALLGGLYILCMSKLAVSLNSDRKFNQLLAA
jgi:hypothetical protein